MDQAKAALGDDFEGVYGRSIMSRRTKIEGCWVKPGISFKDDGLSSVLLMFQSSACTGHSAAMLTANLTKRLSERYGRPVVVRPGPVGDDWSWRGPGGQVIKLTVIVGKDKGFWTLHYSLPDDDL